MSQQSILRIGDPALYDRAKPVSMDDSDTQETQTIIDNLWDTVKSHQGAGLAAPQIGVPLRIIVFGVDTPRYQHTQTIPPTILINPEVEILTSEKEALLEGCLSVKGLRGLVWRPTHIGYRGYDRHGRLIEREARDFHARVFLHELDHLDGVLFTQRVQDIKDFGFEDELCRVSA